MVRPDAPSGRFHRAVDRGRRELELSPEQVFLAYFAYGGTESPSSIYRYLAGEADLANSQYDVLAAALHDEFLDRGMDHLIPRGSDTDSEPRRSR